MARTRLVSSNLFNAFVVHPTERNEEARTVTLVQSRERTGELVQIPLLAYRELSCYIEALNIWTAFCCGRCWVQTSKLEIADTKMSGHEIRLSEHRVHLNCPSSHVSFTIYHEENHYQENDVRFCGSKDQSPQDLGGSSESCLAQPARINIGI